MSRCPWKGCPLRTKSGQLACRAHWFELPRSVRTVVGKLHREEPGSERQRGLAFAIIRLLVKGEKVTPAILEEFA